MNTRLPQGGPPTNIFLARFYRHSLRPAVLGTALLTAIWSLGSGIGFFRNVGPYNDNGAPKLATISIVIGSLYMCIFIIGSFGICAAATQKLRLIRIFAYLSALAVLILVTINLLRIITHFTMRDIIMRACTNAATGQIYVYAGWWGPLYSDTLTSRDAQQFCIRHYDRDSWSLIVGFLILFGIGILFSTIAFAYLRQTLDPSSLANAMRDPQRSGVFPGHYNPPYGAPAYDAPYGQGYNYPAPAGPPPGQYPIPGAQYDQKNLGEENATYPNPRY